MDERSKKSKHNTGESLGIPSIEPTVNYTAVPSAIIVKYPSLAHLNVGRFVNTYAFDRE